MGIWNLALSLSRRHQFFVFIIYNFCHIKLRMDFLFSRTIRSLLRYIVTLNSFEMYVHFTVEEAMKCLEWVWPKILLVKISRVYAFVGMLVFSFVLFDLSFSLQTRGLNHLICFEDIRYLLTNNNWQRRKKRKILQQKLKMNQHA